MNTEPLFLWITSDLDFFLKIISFDFDPGVYSKVCPDEFFSNGQQDG